HPAARQLARHHHGRRSGFALRLRAGSGCQTRHHRLAFRTAQCQSPGGRRQDRERQPYAAAYYRAAGWNQVARSYRLPDGDPEEMTRALCVLLCATGAALPLAAQPKFIVNAKADTRSAAQGLDREFRSLLNTQPQPAWLGYEVPATRTASLG